MITSLTLVNFMAHARTTLELAPGLNVLCGPNNTGKSAVVEALRSLAANPSPRHVIRHGATEARVEAVLDSGWRVSWVRRQNYAFYEVYAPGAAEPETYAKLGRGGVPEEVARLLRLGPVAFEKGQEVDVHLGDQRHPIFLLDQPGSLLADFLASSTESAHLMAMQDLLRDKARVAKKSIKTLDETIQRAEAGLSRLSALPELSLGLESLRAQGRDLEARQAALPALEARIGRLERLGASQRAMRSRSALLEGLAPPPVQEPSAGLAASMAAMEASSRKASAARAMRDRLAPLQAPPALENAGGLAESLEGIVKAQSLHAGAAKRLQALSGLGLPPRAENPAPLADLVSRMEALTARIGKGTAWLAQRDRELEALTGRIAARLKELGECPLCGSAMDAERFLGKAGKREPS